MKKYVFSVLFFLGCFFMCLTQNVNTVKADVTSTIDVDSYDSRKISIKLEGLHVRTAVVKVHEINYCNEGEAGCNSTMVGTQTLFFNIVNSTEIPITFDERDAATIEYNIISEGDGEKNYFVEPFRDDAGNLVSMSSLYYHVFKYNLSTLTQRVVVNADGNGKPLYEFDNVQYTAVRTLPITISFSEYERKNTYSGLVYICEGSGNVCREYVVDNEPINFSIDSYGDGNKQLNIYLVKLNQTINTNANNLQEELKGKSTFVSKNIYLDTVGPEISVEGKGNSWVWVHLEPGQKYDVADTVCKDAVFSNDECVVSNDANVVRIDYNSDKYQFVTYEATDRLGNTTSIPVRIKVAHVEAESNVLMYIMIPVVVMVITGAILGYFLLKSHDKKKKMSYI